MKKTKIEKGSVQETLVIPLYGRKICADAFPNLYRDAFAKDLIERLDYDFSAMEKYSGSFIYKFGALEAALRQIDMMSEIDSYLKNHPKASVVNLGCGLDMSAKSYLDGARKVYNVDFPDIIRAREELIAPEKNEYDVCADINDLSWTDEIESENGAVFFAAGVLHYFTHKQVRSLITGLCKSFRGGRFIFDAVGKFGRDFAMKKTLRTLGINDISGYFYINDAEKELAGLPDGTHLHVRDYMRGYRDLKACGIGAAYRFLSFVGDKVMKMQIYTLDF